MLISPETTERLTENRSVGGSIPPLGTSKIKYLRTSLNQTMGDRGTAGAQMRRVTSRSRQLASWSPLSDCGYHWPSELGAQGAAGTVLPPRLAAGLWRGKIDRGRPSLPPASSILKFSNASR